MFAIDPRHGFIRRTASRNPRVQDKAWVGIRPGGAPLPSEVQIRPVLLQISGPAISVVGLGEKKR